MAIKLEVKDSSVNVWGLHPVMQIALKGIAEVWEKHGQSVLTITSARDGLHSPSSLHYYGLAVDLRIWYFEDDELHQVVAELRDRLEGYDVLLEPSHIHVEAQWAMDQLVESWKQWQ